jgi:hypothetical protein
MARKMALYPELRRHILNFDLRMTPTGPHVNVLSTMSE